MPKQLSKMACMLWGGVFIALGAWLIWAGVTAAPGEPALEIPRREDYSATEAEVIGLAFCGLGVYVALFMRRKP